MRKVFFLLFIFLISLFIYLNRPHLEFTSHSIHLAQYEEVKPYDYIKKYHRIHKKDITIVNHVKDKCGKYTIEYQYKSYKQTLTVYVDDVLPPTFEIKNKKIFVNETIDPNDLVYNIQDDTITKVYFLKDYQFTEEKTYAVEVIVEDEYSNITKKTSYILVESKDIEAPALSGLDTMQVIIDQEIDLTKGIEKSDDHDDNPTLTIDDSQLNLHEAGRYNVIYTIKDKSGNLSSYQRTIIVKSPYENKEAIHDGVKTCYLTFDDGPSYNTPKVLEILKQYNIKATFFVTGTHENSYQYMKEIVDQGHTIGLHSYSHDYENIYTSLSNYMKDLKKIQDLVYTQTKVKTYYIRFPGGSSNLVSKKYNVGIMKRLTKEVIDEGYQYYDWTCVNGDGENIKTVSGLISKAKEEIGDIEDIMFLMHDGSNNDATVKALPTIIEYLIDKGYTFKVIDENAPTFHHTVQN